MVRKLTFAAVAALSLLTPLALTSPAQAEHQRPIAHSRHYHVMYRHCPRDPWACYGTYTCHDEAHDVARYLRHQGYQARVDHP